MKNSRIATLATLFAFCASLEAATFTVTNLNDSGAGSLRDAISSANADPGSTIAFDTVGTINLNAALPDILRPTAIDGSTAPGFSGAPVVAIDFGNNPGLNLAKGADSSEIRSLSLVNSGNSGLILRASGVTVAGNYIGLLPNGTVRGNFGDGVTILGTSDGNVIGNFDPVESIEYFNTTEDGVFSIQPVTAWQGIRKSGTTPGEFLMCGTSNADGLLYVGPIDGGGDSYPVAYPGVNTIDTSVYGPDSLIGGAVRLVGSYRTTGSTAFNYGFLWEGTVDQLPSGGTWTTIDYPGATYQFTHSTLGRLAVGNADGPVTIGNVKIPVGGGKAYIYDVVDKAFVTNVVFPKSKSNSIYGIWQNGPVSYTICGGYSPLAVNNLTNPRIPLTQGKAFLVDYNSLTGKFSNWTSFDYPNGPKGVNFVTHFEGISSQEPGVYTVVADSVQAGTSNAAQGSWVSIRRNSDGSFDKGVWVDLNYPDAPTSISSANSVYGFNVVGLVIGPDTFSYQAVLNMEFQLSNVISGNRGNGVSINGSKRNLVSMNFIGSDPAGSTNPSYGNGANGILISKGSRANLVGGTAFGVNNPTGNKKPVDAVFQRPVQGNLISGNLGYGVLIDQRSSWNYLAGNYIGTDGAGTAALGNQMDGVAIDGANSNTLVGCTFYQNPFVFYNVVGGNRGHGVRVNNSDNTTIHANFLGLGADNATSVPNGGDGLLIEGTSRTTTVGGVIPLGNVISGNSGNGIEVRDSASGMVSFNTFAGVPAFQDFSSPNGLNGILITSSGRNNQIRTCIVSGNLGNGIELGGKANNVQITDTSIGTNTDIQSAVPNLGNGIVLRGSAHDNAIGGFQPSVEPRVFVSGNKKTGIVVTENARDNRIFNTTVGEGAGSSGAIPNEEGGILLDQGTRGTTIGGRKDPFLVTIGSNTGAGLTIFYSRQNDIQGNLIEENSTVGVTAFGNCAGTRIKGNTISDNGPGGTNNVDLTNSSGILFVP